MCPLLHLLCPPEDRHTSSHLIVDTVHLPETSTNLCPHLSNQSEAEGQSELLLVVLDGSGQQLQQRTGVSGELSQVRRPR